MAAAYNKFNAFIGDVFGKVHDLLGTAGSTADTLKILLSNTTPVATNAVKGDLTEITQHNGYSAPVTCTNVGTNTTGTLTVSGTAITITASGGTIGPFQYACMYNSTAGTVPLVAWWDYGSALTLQDGDSLTLKFNSSATTGTIFTAV